MSSDTVKSVLISIRPGWCEKIVSGEKTIEVRKTRPKIDTPFKCFIYCTKNGCYMEQSKTNPAKWTNHINKYGGKVIGEFVCDKLVAVLAHPAIFGGIDTFFEKAIKDACLTDFEVEKYSKGKDVYGWHISDLIIYDKPKELSEFYTECCLYLHNKTCYNNEFCAYQEYNEHGDIRPCIKEVKRPPQSWCYVESEAENE